MHRFYAFDKTTRKAYRFTASDAWWHKHDNYHAISIGFEVGVDITPRQLKALGAREVPWDEWAHSGCQSSCVKRGGKKCQW